MDDAQHQLETLFALESLHDDLLKQLDALDKRVLSVLAECQPGPKNGAPPAETTENEEAARAA